MTEMKIRSDGSPRQSWAGGGITNVAARNRGRTGGDKPMQVSSDVQWGHEVDSIMLDKLFSSENSLGTH